MLKQIAAKDAKQRKKTTGGQPKKSYFKDLKTT